MPRNNCRLLVCLAGAIVFPALAQAPATLLSGVVISQNGAPIANARITAKSIQGQPVAAAEATSDPSGRFAFHSLAAATYDVVVEAPGFYPVTRRGVPVFYDQPFEIEIRMAVWDQGPEGRSAIPNVASVQLFYSTDRSPSGDPRPAVFFTGQRNLGAPVQYGTAEVTVPFRHTRGSLERPLSVLGISYQPDPRKHFVLSAVSPLHEDAFHRALAGRLQRPRAGGLLVFVHGYNTSFEEASVRLAQLSLDLDFRGVPVLFSWPSTGTLAGYKQDEGNVEWATFHFQAFLERLAATYPDRSIYVIAHSMGSRALSYATRNMAVAGGAAHPRFAQIVLAAPDIDAAVFRELAVVFRSIAGHVTLYVSADDFALKQSRALTGYPRAGQGGDTRVVMDGVDTIECTGVDTSFLAHSYYADTVSVVSDLSNVLQGQPPGDRRSLTAVPGAAGAQFYKFRR